MIFFRSGYITLIFLLIDCAAAVAQSPPDLSADFRDTPLIEVLRHFETSHQLSFSFDDDLVNDVYVSCHFTNLPCEEAMLRLLKGTGLDFEIIDHQYIVIKKGTGEANAPPPPPRFTICGTVRDAGTGEPLTGATAYVRNTPHGNTTDVDGQFSLKGNFSPNDTLEIRYLGYEALQITVGNLLDRPCRDFLLELSTSWMPELLITDFAMDMLSLGEQGNFNFKKEKLPTLPGWGEPDVLRMLQLLPGIGSVEESASRLNVRGGTPDQNLVLWDGIPIYHSGHFFGLYDAFNPFVVEEVDVWRGNFGSEYGGRNSSVIDIKSRSKLVDKTTWGAGINLLSAQGFVETPLFRKKGKEATFMLAMRRSYIDAIQSSTYQNLFNQVFQNGRIAVQEKHRNESEFVTWNPAINYGDFNMKFRWKGKKKRNYSITFFNTQDRLDYLFSFDDSISYAATKDVVSSSNFGFSWQHWAEWSPEFNVRYKIAASNFQNEYLFTWNEELRERPFIYRYMSNNKMDDFSVQLHHNWEMSERHTFSFGYHLSVQAASLVLRDTNAVTNEKNVLLNDTTTADLHTFYAQFDYEVSKKFGFMLGIRENHFPSRGIYYSEPRVSFVWRPLGEGFSINGAMGRYWQFVFQIIDLGLLGELGIGEPLWALTNEQIPAQELWQWTLGFRYEKKSLLLDAEIYRKDSRNLTSLNLRVDRGLERPLAFNGRAVATGMDLLVRKRLPPYSLWFSYSLGKVEQQFPDLNNDIPYPARHDIRQQFNMVNMVSLNKWDIAANLHVRGGSPYSVPEVIKVPCPSCTVSNFTHELDFPVLNGARLPGVVRMDMSVTYKFENKNSKGKAGLAIYNLYNRENFLDRDFLLETPPVNQPQDDYNLQTLNRLSAGATPNLFIQWEW